MNIADAVHATVHDYPGGVESLAPRVGIGAQILRNKANPHCHTNQMGLIEASRIIAATGDYRVLQALCLEHSFAAVPLVNGPIGDMALLERVTTVWKEIGDVGQAVQTALADGRVDRREVDRVKGEVAESITALLALQRDLEALEQ